MALELRRWSPFVQTGSYVVWNGNVAQVWVWDAARWGPVSDDNALSASSIPETPLTGESRESGVELVRCLDGVEARLWRNGTLVGSRFWDEIPEQRSWRQFCRSHGLDLSLDLPVLTEAALGNTPWQGRRFRWSIPTQQLERSLVSLLLALFLFSGSWQIAAWGRELAAAERIADEVAARTLEAEPVLVARSEATNLRERHAALNSLFDAPDQLVLMSKFSQHLQPGHTLREWHYNLLQLQVVVGGQGVNALQYAQALQSDSFWADVTAEPGGPEGSVRISARIANQHLAGETQQ